jgi:hypothetical protein
MKSRDASSYGHNFPRDELFKEKFQKHTSVGDTHDNFAQTVLDKKGFFNAVIVFYSVKDVTESSDTCCGLKEVFANHFPRCP